ncbi:MULTISPECIES: hypothetical protein [Streptomyces]|uniref:Lipoprotein n=1 Tax=Streptomyces lonegramiae TaxID=3075524 RepID=A0ABU2XNI3_9ACTN|nr:hypothetical protein [Streptomyces sp. DSM 41529]MDT0547076.1 hypothetical protein [Streptomyces sp. DSM 41529]
MKRGLTTGVAAVAIMAGAAGCTSGGSDGAARGGSQNTAAKGQNIAAPKACADGTYTWLNVSRRPVVTDLAVGTRSEKGGKVSTRGLETVARYTVSVRTQGATLSEKQSIHSLARQVKPVVPLADRIGQTTAYDKDQEKDKDSSSGEGAPGRYVTARAFDLVEADFRYACGDKTVSSGHVVTWRINVSISLECGEKLDKKATDAAREAARLGCREGDRARA